MKLIEIPPSASRTIEGYSKGLGYKFETACADLIDNSLGANASEIRIEIKLAGNSNPSFATIYDNGSGMDFKILKEAMRLGTKKNYSSKADLGKYGLGLKTASLSQTDTLTVITRKNKQKELLIARLDVDQIKKNDKWEIQLLEKKELKEWALKIVENQMSQRKGTLILLENLHIFKNLSGDQALDYYDKNEHELRLHLGMIFHRFLKRKKIYINGSRIPAWDPFCEKEKTKKLKSLRIFCQDKAGKKQAILIKPYILPTEKEFSSKAAWEEASGPKRWNSQQGFYFYRKNRLLTSGGWANCDGRFEEHQKLLRISVDFPDKLDELVNLNINKMQASIPNEVKKEVQNKLVDWRRTAEARYRSKNPSQSRNSPKGRASLLTFVNGSKLLLQKSGSSIRVQYPIKHTPKRIIRLIQSNKTNQIVSVLCLLLHSAETKKLCDIIKKPKEILKIITK
jgi:hypothetical protein